jgi:hypothetical protein
MSATWIVRWPGGAFCPREIARTFPTKRRAVEWARMAGVYSRATIERKRAG